MDNFKKAEKLIKRFKKDKYFFGTDVLDKIGNASNRLGNSAIIFRGTFTGSDEYIKTISDSLKKAGLSVISIEKGSGPNAPRKDVERITGKINQFSPDIVISFGGGSTIDAVKAAIVLSRLGGKVDGYFGTGLVSKRLLIEGKKLLPHIAVQTLASSGAHLTKYSNITDMGSFQKKLIIDDAIIPDYAFFDYSATYNTPLATTCDGALDGLAHMIEVMYGLEKDNQKEIIYDIAGTGIDLIAKFLPAIVNEPQNRVLRNALCYATDLGGCAIMTGGTNGPHLTSFSLVDILSHGRACAILLPYYTVFFSPRIEKSLLLIGNIFKKYGYIKKRPGNLKPTELGLSVAEAMINFQKSIGFPVKLSEVAGFSKEHIEKALKAAKDPRLESKLKNMPVPLDPSMVDEYLRPVLEAAMTGELEKIKVANDI